MKNIPTAEQIANKWALDDGDLLHDAAIEAMKEYANLHREAILKAALESIPCLGSSSDIATYEEVEKEVLNAYPKELIK